MGLAPYGKDTYCEQIRKIVLNCVTGDSSST